MSKIWLITGAARGFGRLWAQGALQRGDKVVAAVRNPDTVADLVKTYGEQILPLRLDVTDRDAVFEAVAAAHRHFGRLDVVLSNAGYGLMGGRGSGARRHAGSVRDQCLRHDLACSGGAAVHARAA